MSVIFIVFAHAYHSLRFSENDIVFKYRDLDKREIDVVCINRDIKSLYLIEVKSKDNLNERGTVAVEAKRLFDVEILKNIGVDETYKIKCIIVYNGKTKVIANEKIKMYAINFESFLLRCNDLVSYLNEIDEAASVIKVIE